MGRGVVEGGYGGGCRGRLGREVVEGIREEGCGGELDKAWEGSWGGRLGRGVGEALI